MKARKAQGARSRRSIDDVDRGLVEHYHDAHLYDFEYRRRRRDVHFYRDLVDRRAGQEPVLDLACGTGRVSRALLSAGHSVIGLDLSLPMLERAREQVPRAARERAHFVCGDARRFELGRKFPVILMAFNSFEHLYTRVDVDACLQSVKRHLAPGGVFAFDVQNPDLAWLTRDPDKRWAKTRFRHPDTGEALMYSTNHRYDPISQIVVIRIYYDKPSGQPVRVVTLSQRKFFPAELEALLAASGFRVDARLSDFSDRPLTGTAESQVLLCSAAD
jgi:SAM-dependent methyltransferase